MIERELHVCVGRLEQMLPASFSPKVDGFVNAALHTVVRTPAHAVGRRRAASSRNDTRRTAAPPLQ
jgi:hypothetical protein